MFVWVRDAGLLALQAERKWTVVATEQGRLEAGRTTAVRLTVFLRTEINSLSQWGVLLLHTHKYTHTLTRMHAWGTQIQEFSDLKHTPKAPASLLVSKFWWFPISLTSYRNQFTCSEPGASRGPVGNPALVLFSSQAFCSCNISITIEKWSSLLCYWTYAVLNLTQNCRQLHDCGPPPLITPV